MLAETSRAAAARAAAGAVRGLRRARARVASAVAWQPPSAACRPRATRSSAASWCSGRPGRGEVVAERRRGAGARLKPARSSASRAWPGATSGSAQSARDRVTWRRTPSGRRRRSRAKLMPGTGPEPPATAVRLDVACRPRSASAARGVLDGVVARRARRRRAAPALAVRSPASSRPCSASRATSDSFQNGPEHLAVERRSSQPRGHDGRHRSRPAGHGDACQAEEEQSRTRRR